MLVGKEVALVRGIARGELAVSNHASGETVRYPVVLWRGTLVWTTDGARGRMSKEFEKNGSRIGAEL